MNPDAARNPSHPPIVVSKAGESVPRIGDLEQLARWMDSYFQIPGSGIRFGFDAIIGLLPGAGDTLTAFVSLYMLNAASRYGVPRVTIWRMALNVVIDLVIGSLPFVGDLFDIAGRSNSRCCSRCRSWRRSSPCRT